MLLNKTQLFLFKYIIPVFLLVITFCNFILPEKTQDFDTLYDYAKRHDDAAALCKAYAVKLKENRISIDESLELMDAYNVLSNNEKTVFDASLKKQKLELFSFYEKLSQSNFPSKSDKGNLILAYNNVLKKKSPLPYLDKIEDHNQYHWNYIAGKYFFDKEDDNKALIYLEKEFELHPNNSRNNELLATEWYYTDENEKLESLLENRPADADIYDFESRYYYESGNWAKLFSTDYLHVFHPYSLVPAIASIIISLVWLFYLNFINVFKSTRWSVVLFLFLGGAVFSFCTPLLTNVINFSVGLNINGNPANDFMYCFIGIGLVEEFVKILPVVLLLIFTIKKCDPIEILIYASASALGFAFIENIIYFSESLNRVSGRAFTATILHMVLSSVIAYFFIYFRYRKGKKAWLAFLPGLFIAAFLHGFYDFWLINKSVSTLFFLSLIFMVIAVFVWTIMINNSLNVSPLFVADKPFEVSKACILLLSGLSSIFLIEFVLTSVNFGPEYANESIKYSMLGGGYMLIILSTNLCKIDLVKGSWEKISLIPFRKMLNIDNLKNMSIVLTHGAQPILPKASYPLRATITKKLVLNGEKNWFLIQLKWPVKINEDSIYNALVKIIHPDKTFSNENVVVKIIYIKNLRVLEDEKISGEHLRYTEVVRCNEWIED